MTSSSPPHTKRRYGPTAMILVALVSATVAAAGARFISRSQRPTDAAAHDGHDDGAAAVYQCPMHPTIVQDHPGDCPICGMKLVKVEKSEASASNDAERRVLFYRSPMDPKQTSPTPRKDEMGMDYLPVYVDEAGGVGTVPGLATVEIDTNRQQLIGLNTIQVARGAVGGAWRTVGRVAIDETRVRHINVKISGFVERVFVDFVGKKVRNGDPLFTIYSPDLLSAQEEYLLALKTKGALSKAGGSATNDGDDLVAAALRKLALWDVPVSEIDRVERSGQPSKTLTFYSPLDGVVTKKDVVEGMKLDAGAMPYEIVDLSSVWVLADVYERELRFVKEGMAARLELNAFPNRDFKGKVVFLDPLLDPKTRTVKVRLTFPNPTGELRPEMFGEVILLGVPYLGLRIPPDAVIDSGTEKVVFVAIGEGKFQPRRVMLGQSDGTHVEVSSGLTEGELVVTRANFLIDSESRLRASLAGMGDAEATATPPQSARVLPGSSEPAPAPDTQGPRNTANENGSPHDHDGHQP
ncbi:MAG: efflux RND transporter periplasmic adaptor subunit [Deltaproteobacteria bacterium]|nr:efflux RND transporter periplasmic adaptor subunit [Deltaproteobacteria bacterium]